MRGVARLISSASTTSAKIGPGSARRRRVCHRRRRGAGLRVAAFEHPTLKILQVKVKPNARTSSLVAQDDGTWLAQIAAPPLDGRANEALIALVARHFGVRRAQVHLKSGASGRMKLVQIDD